ncbi:MAG: helix-turn-helix domain-containing protein, partial [Bacillota bacterium]
EVRSYVGFDSEVEKVKLKPDESMTGITFTSRKPLLFSSYEEVQRAVATMEKANREIIKNTYENLFPRIHSTICCPLIFREKCLGVIVVDNFKKESPLNEDDLEFLRVISIQAAIAVNNALNYEKEIQNNRNLQRYNKIIEKQRNEFEYSAVLHNKLTTMVLEGCSAQDIIHELSVLIDRDIIILDLFFNIRNYVLERSVPLKILKRNRASISQKLSNLSSTVYKIPETDYNLFLNPIVVSKDTLGWLGVISRNPLTSEKDKITLERGSTILALELLKINEIQEIEQKLKGDFLDNLILSYDYSYMGKLCRQYGYNTEKEHQIMVLQLMNTSMKKKDGNLYNPEFIYCQKRLNEYLSRALLTCFPNTISIIKGHNIIFILELNKITLSNLTKKSLEKILFNDQVKSILPRSHKTISAGISDGFADIASFKNSYNNAMQALKIGSQLYQGEFIVFYEELEIKKILLNNPPEVLRDFVEKTLGNLLNYSNASRNEFLVTLLTYIKSNGNWSFTKEKLNIHGNTLSYRLKRIEEILGLDLEDYNHRLKV